MAPVVQVPDRPLCCDVADEPADRAPDKSADRSSDSSEGLVEVTIECASMATPTTTSVRPENLYIFAAPEKLLADADRRMVRDSKIRGRALLVPVPLVGLRDLVEAQIESEMTLAVIS